MSTLLIKNFSGEFNDDNIGHEVINNFKPDNSIYDYFYIPPYGSLGSEKKDFYKKKPYKDIDKIIVFEVINITNVLKLKYVILKPIPFKSYDEMKEESKKIKYNKKPIFEIDFGDKEFIEKKKKGKFFSNDLNPDEMFVYQISYKIAKNSIYSFEDDNIYIWHGSSENRNSLKNDSLEKLKIIANENYKIYELDNLIIGQKQYVYNKIEQLDDWYNKEIIKLIKRKQPTILKKVPKKLVTNYPYDPDNFLNFVNKMNDENYYTNYICGILNSNSVLKTNFFKFLVKKCFGSDDYIPTNIKLFKQYQSLIEPKKIANKYLKLLELGKKEDAEKCANKLKKIYKYTDDMISNLKKSIDGQMDLYIYDDKYRIVIENKILSGLNGKHEDISEDINQLVTYRVFLDDLNRYKLESLKENKVIILCPYSMKENLSNYTLTYGDNNEKHVVPVITYRDLSDFFRDNKDLIIEKYRTDFINTINKQALSKEELITYRFIEATK